MNARLSFLHVATLSCFVVRFPCPWRKLQTFSFLTVSKEVVTSFRVACVALSDIPTYVTKCRKWFCVTGAMLLNWLLKMSLDTGVLGVFCESHAASGCKGHI
jgi:hypothetical protein